MGTWRHCSSCRASIGFEQIYWECSVSTCARVARTGLFFCSVGCWEAHLPTMRHREAWAVEKRSPTEAAWQSQLAEEDGAPARPTTTSSPRQPVTSSAPRQIVSAAPGPEARRQVIAPPAEQAEGD